MVREFRLGLVIAVCMLAAACGGKGTQSAAPDGGEDASTPADDGGMPSGVDAGGVDAGALDAGQVDAGRTDAGPAVSDAGTMTPDAGPQHLQTVFVIMMENKNWGDIKGNANAPYINDTLLKTGAFAENYKGAPGVHPSEPNYLWLEAGTNFGVTTDDDPSANHQSSTAHLVTYLEKAGVSWRSYQEDISGMDCPLTGVKNYVPKHNPMVFFDDVTGSLDPMSQHCIQHVRPYSELAADLQGNRVTRYNFITPNLCDDMHSNCGTGSPFTDGTNELKQGDAWLASNVPNITASQAYKNDGVIFILWDESEFSLSCLGANCAIGMIVLSPLVKGGGYSNQIAYDHSSMLRTIQDIFHSTPYLGAAAQATDLSDFFHTFP
jgi:hypothetical protein